MKTVKARKSDDEAKCRRGERLVNDAGQVAWVCSCGWTTEWVDAQLSPRAAKLIVQFQYAEHLHP